jgi:uncharacterized coiled-coil protein SlyX
MEKRLIDLEIRYTHLERQVADLSEVVFEQRQVIEGLKRELRELRRQLPSDEELPPHEKPPHY